MFPSAAHIAELLTQSGRGRVLFEENVILMIPPRQGWVIRLVVGDELVHVFTGSGVRILVGEDDPGDVSPLLEVIAAVINGDIEEFFGAGDEGPLTSVGHRVWYSGGERRTGSEGFSTTVRAPAWS